MYATVGPLELWYEIHGSSPGEPLVLLHGAVGTIESCFAALLPRLAEQRRVIAVELQGHGHTPDIDRPITYESMADDVAGLLDVLGIPTADVAGYSMGGGVAIQVAVRHPDRARRVVYLGGPAYDPAGIYPEVNAGFDAGPPELTGSPWHQGYLRVAPDPEAWDALVAKVNVLDSSWAGFPPEQIEGIEAPTLLILGDSDIARPEHTVAMFRLLGGGVPSDVVPATPSRLAILPGTGHISMLDRTDWLASMILEFVG